MKEWYEKKRQEMTEIANDDYLLEAVLLPAIRKASIRQHDFVARYMGFTQDDILKNSKIVRKSDENQAEKIRLIGWESKGLRIYTMDDVPEPYKSNITIAGAIERLAEKNENLNYAVFCGKVYFTGLGLSELSEYLVQHGHLTGLEASRFSSAVRGAK